MNGKELQDLRKRVLRLKQGEFGKIVGVHATTVSDWERDGAKREVPPCAALVARLMAEDPVLQRRIEQMAGV